MKVLLVEDDVLFRQMLKDTIIAAFPSISVIETPDIETALREIRKSLPDLAFVDIYLPGGNGLDLTRAVKASDARLKIVILTSHDTPEHREAARECGADEFLGKGTVSPEDIEEAVKRFSPLLETL
jgi:DNA-binding NarL/FixJ family response regulator